MWLRVWNSSCNALFSCCLCTWSTVDSLFWYFDSSSFFVIWLSVVDGWRYNPRGGFDEIFHPLSKNCTHADVAGAEAWGMNDMNSFWTPKYSIFLARYKSADVVEIPLIDNIHPKEDFMPMTVPADLSQRLIRLHGNPFVWFTGQLMKYLLRPQPWLTELLAKKFEAIKFETPMVG